MFLTLPYQTCEDSCVKKQFAKVQFTMRYQWAALTALVLALAYQSSRSSHASESKTEKWGISKLPKMFNFERFKSIFTKRYEDHPEESSRHRIYLGQAFKAFISQVSYRHKKSTSFLKVNQMSDWTQEEYHKILLKEPFFADVVDSTKEQIPVEEKIDEKSASEDVVPLEEEQIIEKFEEVIQNRGNMPGYKEIAEELEKAQKEEVDKEKPKQSRVRKFNEKIQSGFSHLKEKIDHGFHLSLKMVFTFMDSVINVAFNTYHGYHGKSNKPDEVFSDLRGNKCLNPVRNQGKCGSCYVFAALTLYEYAYCLKTGENIELSEQYFLDCSDKVGRKNGCQGGFSNELASFVKKFGLELREDYPYFARDSKCIYGEFHSPNEMGSLRVTQPMLKMIMHGNIESLLARGIPVLVSIATSDDFQQYGGGVQKMNGCIGEMERFHVMTLVGSGREGGYEYWIFRNSYGPHWGEEGYYRLRKDSGCLVHFTTGTLDVFAPGPQLGLYMKDTIKDYEFVKNPHQDRSALRKVREKTIRLMDFLNIKG